MRVREIIPCQTCNRDIEDLSSGVVVWCTTKDELGSPSIKVVHLGGCDPWRGKAPHSRPLKDFEERADEVRRAWAAVVKGGGMTAPIAWEGIGRIYEGISNKEYFAVEPDPTPNPE